MGVSRLLGARARAAPKSMPMILTNFAMRYNHCNLKIISFCIIQNNLLQTVHT